MKRPSNRTWRRMIGQAAARATSQYVRWVDGIDSSEEFNIAERELHRLLRAALPDPTKKGAKKR